MIAELTTDRALVAVFLKLDEDLFTPLSDGKLRVVAIDTSLQYGDPGYFVVRKDVDSLTQAKWEISEICHIVVPQSGQTATKAYVFDFEGKLLLEDGSF